MKEKDDGSFSGREIQVYSGQTIIFPGVAVANINPSFLPSWWWASSSPDIKFSLGYTTYSPPDVHSLEFNVLGKDLLIPTNATQYHFQVGPLETDHAGIWKINIATFSPQVVQYLVIMQD